MGGKYWQSGVRRFYHHKIVPMSVTILTKEDLHQFKKEFFEELTRLFTNQVPQKKKWLKSYEVREMLGISRGTLQNLKDNGTLHPTLVGGLLFYDYDEIFKLMSKGK